MSVKRTLAWAPLLFCSLLSGQESSKPATKSSDAADWGVKTIQLNYLDPEQLRSLFSGRSHVMEANRGLKALTVRGPQEFLKEVEETGKRFDVAPPAPADIQVTVYLLAAQNQSPSAQSLPAELQTIAESLAASDGPSSFQLIDCQIIRLREGQSGGLKLADSSGAAPALTRIAIRSASLDPSPKGGVISLNGLQCWLYRPGLPTAFPSQLQNEADIAADLDVTQNQPVLVAKAGMEKPFAVIVRASVAR